MTAFYDSAVKWWGESWYEGTNLKPRLERVRRFAGDPPKRILDLGAGTGETAAFLAADGYQVTAVDLGNSNYELLCAIQGRFPGFTAINGDFYTVSIPGSFDAVCLFETFGMGTDAEQRILLKRVSAEWLAPGGVLIMDVYHPFGPIRRAGSSQYLDRLENVPGSVAMNEHCDYDAVQSRWIDGWEPVGAPEQARMQSVRCYAPADLLLLLEGTGLRIQHAECLGETFDPAETQVSAASPMHQFEKGYSYSVVLTSM